MVFKSHDAVLLTKRIVQKDSHDPAEQGDRDVVDIPRDMGWLNFETPQQRQKIAERIESLKGFDTADLIARGEKDDIQELYRRYFDREIYLSAQHIDALSQLDDDYAAHIVRMYIDLGNDMTPMVKSKLCKSDSADDHQLLIKDKRTHDSHGETGPFLSDTQLFELSVSNDRYATQLVFESLANDPDARHDREPRENPNSKITVHSKSMEIRSGVRSSLFAASVEAPDGKTVYLATRDPIEMILGIENTLQNTHDFRHGPNTPHGIVNTAFEERLLTQLDTSR